MWLLNPPSVRKVTAHLQSALTHANGTSVYALSAAEKLAIASLYRSYDAHGGQPHASLKPAALKAAMPALKKAYDQIQIGGRLERLRAEIRGDLLECPLCGYGDPNTLDHYLPRSSYKALAIYPRNLVPACQHCNRKKGAGVPNGNQGFIHPYFDAIRKLPGCGEPFLHADVAYAAGRLDVSFRIQHPTLDALTQARLTHQLTKLELDRRYGAPINVFMFGMMQGLLDIRGPQAAKLRSIHLSRSARIWRTDFGNNDWRVALLRSLSACGAFCADPRSYYKRRLGRRRRGRGLRV